MRNKIREMDYIAKHKAFYEEAKLVLKKTKQLGDSSGNDSCFIPIRIVCKDEPIFLNDIISTFTSIGIKVDVTRINKESNIKDVWNRYSLYEKYTATFYDDPTLIESGFFSSSGYLRRPILQHSISNSIKLSGHISNSICYISPGLEKDYEFFTKIYSPPANRFDFLPYEYLHDSNPHTLCDTIICNAYNTENIDLVDIKPYSLILDMCGNVNVSESVADSIDGAFCKEALIEGVKGFIILEYFNFLCMNGCACSAITSGIDMWYNAFYDTYALPKEEIET